MKKLVSVLLALLLVIGTQPSVGVQSGNKCRQIVDSVRIACSNLLVFVVYFLRKGSSPVSRSNIKKSDSKRNHSFLLRAPPWLEVRGLGCRLGRSKTVSTGHQLRLALYTVRSISTPFSSIAFKSSSNASSSVIRTSKALIGQMLIIESVPILPVG